MPKTGRNDPCPCGSGKKYKHCCMQTALSTPTSQSSLGTPESAGAQDFSSERCLRAALEHHQAGRLPQAEALYREILQHEPRHADALHYLGVLAQQVGRLDIAVELITAAIAINPRNATYCCNLGCVLRQGGKAGDAATALRTAISLEPELAAAHYNLGLALQDQDRQDESISSYERALALQPNYAEAYGNLGFALQRQGRTAEAIASYRQALACKPSYSEAHYNLGNALNRQGEVEEAIASYRGALAVRPDYAEAHNNLGNALKSLDRIDEAIASYRAALAVRPEFAEAYINLADALQRRGRLAEAIAAGREALRLTPESPEAHFNLANALQEQGDLDQAVATYQRALALKPDYAEACANLGRALQEQAKIAEAARMYDKAIALQPDYAGAFSNLIYLHAFARDISPEEGWRLASRWETAVLSDEERAAARQRRFTYVPRAGRKLRLGVVSAELGQHAVAEFLEPFLEQLDRDRFHLSLYPIQAKSGERAERIQRLADVYTPLIRLSDADAAAQIRADGIDVLMDTTAHTNNCRLGIFAHRAAPVQCTYVGFWASTGLTEMDWYIGDDITIPSSCDAHFRERIWRLPRFGAAYRGDPSLPAEGWRPSADGTVWLGSFNKYSKIREQSLALWARVLQALPEARLLLEDRTPFDCQLHPRILAELRFYGVAADRVEFWPYTPGWRAHMLLYNRLDIALDTVPFNSGTTAFDALWMGVPLVALEGDWSGGRLASAVLRYLGRPEWVASNEREYVSAVVALARDVELRKPVRFTQRAQMATSKLCDAKDLARELQEALGSMYDLCGAAPQNRQVPS